MQRERHRQAERTYAETGETVQEIVKLGAVELGVQMPLTSLAAFAEYYRLLEEFGNKMNLTAIKDAEDVARLHFLDSIALKNFHDFKYAKVIDIGSGAGFPGIPLKLAEPSVELTLLEATGKKVAFLEALAKSLGVNAKCLHARAEEASHSAELRERHDAAVSRAVARLNVLCELCMPFVKVGGVFIAMKSANSADEICEAAAAAETLGGAIESIHNYTIPGANIIHTAVIIRKISKTPAGYPRRYSTIKKQPLL